MSTCAARAYLLLSCVAALLATTGCEESRAPAASGTPVASATPASQSAAPATVTAGDSTAPAAESQPAAPVAARPAENGKPQDITFDTLKFPLEKNADYQRSALTPEVEALNGRPVKLRGYILPSFQQSGITQFVLVRDNMECCFGPGAALYDCVVVDMKPGKTTEYTVRPVAVEGTFELRDFKGPDGKYLAIYHLDGDAVRN